MRNKDLESVVNFIYEAGILSKTPRSGLWFLGTGNQSVAEHIFRTTVIGYLLSNLAPKADKARVIFLCLAHDLGEARTSDLNYVHQKYGRLAEAKAIEDISISLPFGKEIATAYKEAHGRETLEAKLAKDADQLEWIATLREEEVKGNAKVKAWVKIAYKRLQSSAGRKIGKLLMSIHPDDWWFDEKDKWYVDRNPKLRKWKNK